jgi:hypothetical protein
MALMNTFFGIFFLVLVLWFLYYWVTGKGTAEGRTAFGYALLLFGLLFMLYCWLD